MPRMVTGDQIRAARALLRWSARELAERAGVSLPTIQRMEGPQGTGRSTVEILERVQRALEAAGVEFIPAGGGGVGVRFRGGR